MRLTPSSRLILLLLANTSKTYVDLLSSTNIHPNTLTKLLKSLSDANLIAHDRAANSYSLTPAPIPSDSSLTPVPLAPLTT